MAASGARVVVSDGTSKKAAAKTKTPRAKPTHPKTAEMVNSAIKALKERGGSSVQAIKKYMVGTYKVDAEKQATFIKKYLKAAVASGVLIQTKGKGAAGSFKLASAKLVTTKPKVKSISKIATPKKTSDKKPGIAKKRAVTAAKKVPTKKSATPKKSTASKGPAAKPPKAKTTKPKLTPRSAAKAKPAAVKKAKPTATKPKKAAPKKTTVPKK